MSNFTEFAETKNAADFKEMFQQALAAKVADALEIKKIEVAQKFFNTEAADQVEESEQVDECGMSTPVLAKKPVWPAPSKGSLPKTKETGGAKKEGVKEDVEQIDELSKALLSRYIDRQDDDVAHQRAYRTVGQKEKKGTRERNRLANKIKGVRLAGRKTGYRNPPPKVMGTGEFKYEEIEHEDVEQIDEKITKAMKAGEVVHDFVHSDDPRLAKAPKKERIRRALGAYYKMHPELSRKAKK